MKPFSCDVLDLGDIYAISGGGCVPQGGILVR